MLGKSSKLIKIILAVFIFLNLTSIVRAAMPSYEGVPVPADVLIVYNSSYSIDTDSDGVQDSLEIANYYKSKRNIPDTNVLGIIAPTTEVITRTQYNEQIKPAIEKYLTDSGLKNSIKYIVLVKGVPLKILATNGLEVNYGVVDNSSVDSAVCLLFETYNIQWSLTNPYFNADSLYSKNFRFKNHFYSSNGVYLRYLVTRLDGYSISDIKGMIDRALAADITGTGYWVIDDHKKSYDFMEPAWNKLKSLGQNVNPDPWSDTTSYITSNSAGEVIGYISHGIHADMGDGYVSNIPANPNHLNFNLLPGAVFSTYESYNGYGFVSGNQSNHGQVAEWIKIGGSGGIGNVYEPWASGIAHEEIFMPLYAIGYPWADAAYQSLEAMDFVTVVIGDPLMTIREVIPPGEVSNMQATALDSSISLSWNNPADNDFAGVKIVRKAGSYSTNISDGMTVYKGTANSFLDTGLQNGTNYFYTAYAYDEVPNYSPGKASDSKIYSSPVSGSDSTPPSEVYDMKAVALDSKISLSWKNPSDADFIGVKILRKTDSYSTNSSDGLLIYSGAANSFLDTGLQNGTNYFYTAYAYDGAYNYSSGNSIGSRISKMPVLIILPPNSPFLADNIPPGKPMGLSVIPGNGQISLSWTNPTDADFSGVKIIRRTNYYPNSATNGTLVYKGLANSFLNTGLQNGTTYFYTIFAFDSANNYSLPDSTVKAKATPYSSTPTGDTDETDIPSTSFVEPHMSTQGNISNMTAQSSTGRIILTWSNPFNDVNWKGTKLVRKIGSYPLSPTDGKIIYNGLASTYTDTSVSSGTVYYYSAFSYNDWRNYSDGTVDGAKVSITAQ